MQRLDYSQFMGVPVKFSDTDSVNLDTNNASEVAYDESLANAPQRKIARYQILRAIKPQEMLSKYQAQNS